MRRKKKFNLCKRVIFKTDVITLHVSLYKFIILYYTFVKMPQIYVSIVMLDFKACYL